MIFHLTKAIRHLVVHSFVFKGAIEGKKLFACQSLFLVGKLARGKVGMCFKERFLIRF